MRYFILEFHGAFENAWILGSRACDTHYDDSLVARTSFYVFRHAWPVSQCLKYSSFAQFSVIIAQTFLQSVRLHITS